MIGAPEPPRDLPSALALAALAALATALAFPYLATLLPKLRESPIAFPLMAAVGGLQTGVMTLLLGWVGLRLGRSVGLGAPMLGAWLGGGEKPVTRWLTAALIGVAMGALVVALDRVAFLRFQPPRIQQLASSPAGWRGVLAAPYGGVVEEIMTRLFLTTLLAWIVARVAGDVSPAGMTMAILVAAIGFGAAHLRQRRRSYRSASRS
jgi:hypothetical protein